jgi:hypothetical protein
MIINSTINKTDRVVNSTIDRKYGVDGKSIEADIDIAGQRVGFKQEGEVNFTYIDLPKLEFDDLTQAQKDSLKLTFDQLTQAEKDSLKGSDANVTRENIESALPYTIAKDNEVLKIDGKRPQNYTETDYTNYRPVVNSQIFYASPSNNLTQLTDFHVLDLIHRTGSLNSSPNLNLYTFEIRTEHQSDSGNIGRLVAQYNAVRNAKSKDVQDAVGIQLWNKNTGSGNISNSQNILIYNPENSGGGVIEDAYGIYIQEFTTGTNRNYGVYSLGINFFNELEFNTLIPSTTDLVSKLNAEYIGGVKNDRLIYGSNQRGTTSTTNCDLIIKSGFYSANTNTLNVPYIGFWGIYHNQIFNLDVYSTQIAINFENGDIYSRHNNAGTWGNWIKLISEKSLKETERNYTAKQTFSNISVGTGASGSYSTADGKTVTVTDGIITSIV